LAAGAGPPEKRMPTLRILSFTVIVFPPWVKNRGGRV